MRAARLYDDDPPSVRAFYASMKLADQSPATIRRRLMTVRRLGRFIGADPVEATMLQVEAWLASLEVVPASRGLYFGDLRAFFRWAVRHDHLEVSPTDKIDGPRRTRYVPRPIDSGDLRRAIDTADEQVRRCLILAAFAGLRCSEIAGLRGDHVDHDAGMLRIKGKGQKVRLVEIHPAVAEILEGVGPGEPVVTWRTNGRPMSADSVGRNVRRHLRALGLDDTAHSGRHWFGSQTYAACRDLRAVQELLGHASPQTTAQYVQFSREVTGEAVAALKLG